MKTSAVLGVGAILVGLAGGAFADPRSDQVPPKRKAAPAPKYVMVTGSLIPRQVKGQAIGTQTSSPLRVYDRREIDKTGRFTTTQILADDPSARVLGHPGG